MQAFYAIEISKPSLCWILITKASELCQTLGYHRAETYKNEDPEDARHKEFLFWAVYLLDRSLCLRLGRSSSIQDYDITVPYPTGTVPHRIAIAEFMKLWIKGSQIQGLIYERLYSPEAVRQPEDVRRSRMQSLVEQLKELEDSTNDVIVSWHSCPTKTLTLCVLTVLRHDTKNGRRAQQETSLPTSSTRQTMCCACPSSPLSTEQCPTRRDLPLPSVPIASKPPEQR
jgi:hypothetical protein